MQWLDNKYPKVDRTEYVYPVGLFSKHVRCISGVPVRIPAVTYAAAAWRKGGRLVHHRGASNNLYGLQYGAYSSLSP